MKRPRGTGSLFKKPGSRIWWIKYYRGGIPVRESTGKTNKIEAGNILKDKVSPTVQALTGPRVGRVKVQELAADLITDYRIRKRKSTEWTQRRWNKHLSPFFGNILAAQVTTDLIKQYICLRQDAGAENSTINRDLALLSRAFNLARRQTPPKVFQVPLFPNSLEESPPRSGFVEDGDYGKLCQNCNKLWLRSMLACGYTYGFRRSELLNLRVRQVDLLERTIVLDPGTTKNRQGRIRR